MEFKENDKVMGIHTDFVGRSELVCGKIIRIETNSISNQVLRYHITGIEYKFSGILNPNEIVKFEGFKWMQIEIFFREQEELLKEANEKFKMIKTELYHSDGAK